MHPSRVGLGRSEPSIGLHYGYAVSAKGRPHVSRDGDGSFRLGLLPPGDYRASGPWGASYRLEGTFTVAAGKVTRGVVLRKAACGDCATVQGRLVDAAGAPVANAEALISGKEGIFSLDVEVRRVRTDEAGRFSLYPIASGYCEYRPSLSSGKWGPVVKMEVRPGETRRGVVFRLSETVAARPADSVGPPDPPGAWGKTVNGWRTRVTPAKRVFRRWEPVRLKVELENLGKWPRTYRSGGIRGVRPDGRPVRNVEMPVQTMEGERPSMGPGERTEWTMDYGAGRDLTMLGRYRAQLADGTPPASNVAEFEIVSHDDSQPLPPISVAVPPGFVDAIESVLPKGWSLMGITDSWAAKKGFSTPRTVWIRCRQRISTSQAIQLPQSGMQYWLHLYDLRYGGPDPIEARKADGRALRLLGETEWYRVYAEFKPDLRLGWEDADGDIAKALKLENPKP